MSHRFFVTGTGTGIGKTLVSAILAEALQADYWKPVQAGFAEGTDSGWVRAALSNTRSVVHPEAYRLALAASPHIAARAEDRWIDPAQIQALLPAAGRLIVEGAGGLLVPLNDRFFVADLIRLLSLKVILVSRNELGSINHALLTAAVCRQYGLEVEGWIFNGRYLDYEEEIVQWTGIRKIGSVPQAACPDRAFVARQADIFARQFPLQT